VGGSRHAIEAAAAVIGEFEGQLGFTLRDAGVGRGTSPVFALLLFVSSSSRCGFSWPQCAAALKAACDTFFVIKTAYNGIQINPEHFRFRQCPFNTGNYVRIKTKMRDSYPAVLIEPCL